MQISLLTRQPTRTRSIAVVIAAVAAATLAAFGQFSATLIFVANNIVEISPLLIPGFLLAGWVSASGAGLKTADTLRGNQISAVFAASAIGALTPVCGVTVLPLMIGLLAAGVPYSPVLAFWLSSPITDPAMFGATAATLGFDFAVGKALAAFGLGVLGGVLTMATEKLGWMKPPLRANSLVRSFGQRQNSGVSEFNARIWEDEERTKRFWREVKSLVRLVLVCLTPAFAVEHLLGLILNPDGLSVHLGNESIWAVPLAVFVGAPLYIDGYAALPLVRALLDHGMSPSAGMAFMVSGGVVSIWGAIAIFPVLRLRPFCAYLAIAVAGSLAAGWLFGFAVV